MPAPTDKPFRILALEGGGSLAMNYLPILSHIEKEHFGGACLRDSGAFQMFMGTSTGAIVAAALAAGAPAEAVTAMYREELRAIFRKTRFWNRPLFYLFDSEQLNAVLRRRFREYTGGSDITWADLSRRLAGRAELVVTLWKESHGQIKFVTTDLDNEHPYHERGLHGALVADVITACCSAPYYFSPRAFYHTPAGGGEAHLGTYCDGGITGLNNPGVLGISLAWRKAVMSPRPPNVPDLRGGAGEIQLVSMGTGFREVNISPARRARWWVMDTASHTISDLMAASASLMHQFHGAFGERLTFTKYLRTDQPIEEDAGLDEIDPRRLAGYEGNFAAGNVTYHLAAHAGGSPRAVRDGNLTPDTIGGVLTDFGVPRLTAPPAPPPEPPAVTPATVRSVEVTARLRRRLLWSGLAFSFVPLFLAVVVLLGVAARNLLVVRDQNRQLADRNTTITDQRDILDAQATKQVTEQVGTYKTPLTKLALFLVTPVKSSGAPFHDRAANVRECDELVRYFEAEFPVGTKGFAANDELRTKHQEFVAELRAWKAANGAAASPPHRQLFSKTSALLWAVRNAADPITRGRLDDKSLSAAEQSDRTKHVLVASRANAYAEIRRVIRVLVDAAALDEPAAVAAYREFWELYWGGLLLFESPLVENMMVELGGDPGLKGWARSGTKPARFKAKANWTRDTVRGVLDEAAAGTLRAGLSPEFNANDYLLYLDYQIEVMQNVVKTHK